MIQAWTFCFVRAAFLNRDTNFGKQPHIHSTGNAFAVTIICLLYLGRVLSLKAANKLSCVEWPLSQTCGAIQHTDES